MALALHERKPYAENARTFTVGIVVGIAGAAMLTRPLSTFLYGVSAIDPLAFLTAAAALLAFGTAAALLPAWRAGTADPLTALREQ